MILIATDKFKGTLTAREATDIIGKVMADSFPVEEIITIPVADGGEGTAEVIAGIAGMDRRCLVATTPTGRSIQATYYIDGARRVAVDAATVLGLTLVDHADRNPMKLSSAALGRLLREIILKESPSELILGVGGTATSDGGAGMLQALDATIEGVTGEVTPDVLDKVSGVDCLTMIGLPPMRLLCDVDVPLVAPEGEGSAMTFAPQKGLREIDRSRLREALTRWGRMVGTNAPFSGAGGGLISGLMSRFQPEYGADAVLSLAGVERLTPRIVITGEGCVDRQSVMGKITGRVARYGRSRGARVIAIGGMAEPGGEISAAFDAVYSTLDDSPATADASSRLALTAARVARDIGRYRNR